MTQVNDGLSEMRTIFALRQETMIRHSSKNYVIIRKLYVGLLKRKCEIKIIKTDFSYPVKIWENLFK